MHAMCARNTIGVCKRLLELLRECLLARVDEWTSGGKCARQ